MKRWALSAAGVLAVGAAAAFTFANGGDDDSGDRSPESSSDALVAPPAEVGDRPVGGLAAEPAPTTGQQAGLTLSAPAEAEVGASVTFEAGWVTPDGDDVDGEVELQRVEGADWTTVDTITTQAGAGSTAVRVPSSGIYRLAYGGSSPVEAATSSEVTVIAGELIPSHLTITATPAADGLVDVAGAWTTEAGVPISGTLDLQVEREGAWVTVTTLDTGDDGTGTTQVEVGGTTSLRLAYSGGSRFAAVGSPETLALGDDVRSIPVTPCTTDHEIDGLPRGAGCHFTPVTAGTFVVGHDYLDNAWWNAAPIGSYVELTGDLAGLYEVVDRVIAPSRGAALGPAADWTCGDECDVILQTCKGSRTGFTWLRRADAPADAA